jgi:hypothetical protein
VLSSTHRFHSLLSTSLKNLAAEEERIAVQGTRSLTCFNRCDYTRVVSASHGRLHSRLLTVEERGTYAHPSSRPPHTPTETASQLLVHGEKLHMCPVKYSDLIGKCMFLIINLGQPLAGSGAQGG